MTKRTERSSTEEGVVWVGHDQVLIVEPGEGGHPEVEVVSRGPAESDATFEGRAIDEVIDWDRVVVTGPAFARTEFERAYVAVTHRPDRLVDVEPKTRRPRARG